jgi:hypothetical protein
MTMSSEIPFVPPRALLAVLAAYGLTGCGNSAKADPAADTAATTASQELDSAAKREAELAAREQALAEREAEFARVQQKAETSPTPEPQSVAKAMPIIVPAGTQLSVSLTSDITTSTARVGDPVDARLASDLVMNGRTALPAGAPVHGTVTQVVSGSAKIGGVPTLALTFDRLDLGNGKTVPISGRIVRQGKSETAKDTAKIVGGAAAGAIIGHQIEDGDKGKVLGGLLGGAAGAFAAHKTGGEVTVPAGSVLVVVTEAGFEIGGE